MAQGFCSFGTDVVYCKPARASLSQTHSMSGSERNATYPSTSLLSQGSQIGKHRHNTHTDKVTIQREAQKMIRSTEAQKRRRGLSRAQLRSIHMCLLVLRGGNSVKGVKQIRETREGTSPPWRHFSHLFFRKSNRERSSTVNHGELSS